MRHQYRQAHAARARPPSAAGRRSRAAPVATSSTGCSPARPTPHTPEPPIRSLAGYSAYLGEIPDRLWCQTAENEIEHVGKIEPGTLANLGTIQRDRSGVLTLTANSQARP
jgi:hypothetical protein